MKAVYSFEEGHGQDRMLLGGKGAGLCEMTSLGLPVPPGFVITTAVCKEYYANGRIISESVMRAVRRNIAKMARATGKKWKSKTNPLLVSVRSGAALSMPGMMDTILNLGLNDQTVEGLAEQSGSPRFAWDSYRRFVQLFGKVVFGVDDAEFDHILHSAKKAQGVDEDAALNKESLYDVVRKYKEACQKHTGSGFPEDPDEQLEMAIKAVFASWMGERAVVYREKNHITPDIADGTAVNVVTMVFGNMGDDSATGVVFTRDPGNGARRLFGDYLVNAQGEDVVAGTGTRTPMPISRMKRQLPDAYETLADTCAILEKHYREPQDIEFTLEQGRFYMLQTRNAKMNASAMIRTSVEMVQEGLIDKRRAVSRMSAEQLEQLLHPSLDAKASRDYQLLGRGIAASPGAASGKAIFDVAEAVKLGEAGENVILVREETKPEDVPAFFASEGILTSRGGKTSHAAVVARGMGKPCIVGCSALQIGSGECFVGDVTVHSGDHITIDGSTGSVYVGIVPTVQPRITSNFKTILEWARKGKRLGIRANADTPQAARLARRYGAEGIGLCRTERMFNAADRIGLFVQLIMAKDADERRRRLAELQKLQRSDFVKIFQAMEGYPVTIRLLDPPLHEFLPNPEELASRLAKSSGEEAAEMAVVLQRARDLAETNPMMGHRGVRVGVTYPEIYQMQITAVFEATISLQRRGIDARPQIMIPQVGSIEELDHIKAMYDLVRARMEEKHGGQIPVSFGTMIEVVRAAVTADKLAATAEFFSFGTNDLTQAVYSFSREDAEGKFLPEYMEKELLARNPFQTLDPDGVGELMTMAIQKGRRTRPGMEVGICGEHGGDPSSIAFCNAVGVDYVSASPHRIPIAMVAAAQATDSES